MPLTRSNVRRILFLLRLLILIDFTASIAFWVAAPPAGVPKSNLGTVFTGAGYIATDVTTASNVDHIKELFHQRQHLAFALTTTSLLRSSVLGVTVVSDSFRPRRQIVAAVCLFSLLVCTTTANFLFQARSATSSASLGTKMRSEDRYSGFIIHHQPSPLSQYLPAPSLPLQLGLSTFLTLTEWALYLGFVTQRARNTARASSARDTEDEYISDSEHVHLCEDAEEQDEVDEQRITNVHTHDFDSEETPIQGEQDDKNEMTRGTECSQGDRFLGSRPRRTSQYRVSFPSTVATTATVAADSRMNADLEIEQPPTEVTEYNRTDDDDGNAIDIIDIPPDRSLSRQLSRRRLRASMISRSSSSPSPSSPLPTSGPHIDTRYGTFAERD